jgi:hydroxymethylglutaryl-CoA reductase (NADPH)
MGMNMVSKGVQNVLDFLQNDFPDMDVIGISGNFRGLFDGISLFLL